MCAGHEVIIQVIVLHDFNFHLVFAILQDLQSGFARLSHHAVYKPLLQGVATMWTKGGFSGNYIWICHLLMLLLDIFLNTGSSPHIFMKLSSGSHMVKVVPIGCGRNRRPVSTSFVV